MKAGSLYCISLAMKNLMVETAIQMAQKVEPPIRLVEYIILPDLGQRIILRFEFGDERRISFEGADRLEPQLRSLAGPEYWVTLIGSCYQHIPPDLVQRQITIDQKISSDVLQFLPTRHSDLIRKDAEYIRGRLKLSDADRIWEIEVPILSTMEEPVIRIIESARAAGGRSVQRRQRSKIGGTEFAVDYFQNDPSFIGLVKAYFMAEQQHIALASYVARFDK